jgi:cell division protein FtsI (penicillin-binding protein 3)
MLEMVVSDSGTAPMAAIPGYRVAGKTGTAQFIDPSCGCYNGGVIASFIGMAPADNPALVVAVTLVNPRNGRYGGELAAPVFRKVMRYALQARQVPPSGTSGPRMTLTSGE